MERWRGAVGRAPAQRAGAEAAPRTTSPRRIRRQCQRFEHHTVDVEMAHRVAEAFNAAPRSSNGATVESAYAAVGEQAAGTFAS